MEVAEHKMALRSSFLQTMPNPEALLAVPGSDKDMALLKEKMRDASKQCNVIFFLLTKMQILKKKLCNLVI